MLNTGLILDGYRNRMALRRLLIVLAIWLTATTTTLAGGGPQNLALVVNPDDPASMAVANCYVELRNLPPSNVFYVPWAIDARSTNGVKFRDLIMKPVMEEVERRGLAGQIDYLAFSSGFPYLIDCAPAFEGTEFPKQARPLASLTSSAYLNQFLVHGHPAMFALNSNSYFMPTTGGVTTSRAFSSRQKWGADGKAVADNGMKYLICTALGVTHGHGNKVDEIIASLRRSRAADGTAPRGTIYYMQNNDIRSKTRHNDYPAAVKELAALGVKGAVQQGTAPKSADDVAGLTTGISHLLLGEAGCTLLPGAIVDNLTSSAGQMLLRKEGNPQTRISEFIRMGASGASGAVIEPYAIAAKFPSPAIHVHYARGCSLGEAFYQSVAAPAQLLIIGDPLCQPWAISPKVSVTGASDGALLSGDVALVPQAKYPDARQPSRFELYVDGVRTESVPGLGQFTLKTATLADGWHELRIVAIDNTPVAVQGAWVATVQVKQGSDVIGLAVAGPKRFAESGSAAIDVVGSAGKDVHIVHNGRRVGVAKGGNGRVEIPGKLLGKGKLRLYGEQEGTPVMRSKPIEVEIF